MRRGNRHPDALRSADARRNGERRAEAGVLDGPRMRCRRHPDALRHSRCTKSAPSEVRSGGCARNRISRPDTHRRVARNSTSRRAARVPRSCSSTPASPTIGCGSPKFDSFSSKFNVIRYDLRGFGKSTMPEEKFALRDDLLAVLAASRHPQGCAGRVLDGRRDRDRLHARTS